MLSSDLSMIHSDSSTSREKSCSDRRIYHPVESTQVVFVGSDLTYSPQGVSFNTPWVNAAAVSAGTPGTGEQAEKKKRRTWIKCLETVYMHIHIYSNAHAITHTHTHTHTHSHSHIHMQSLGRSQEVHLAVKRFPLWLLITFSVPRHLCVCVCVCFLSLSSSLSILISPLLPPSCFLTVSSFSFSPTIALSVTLRLSECNDPASRHAAGDEHRQAASIIKGVNEEKKKTERH